MNGFKDKQFVIIELKMPPHLMSPFGKVISLFEIQITNRFIDAVLIGQIK